MKAEKAIDAFGWCALRPSGYSNDHRVTRSRSFRPAGLPTKEAYERLEPCEGKLSCTVLRGLGAGNSPRLPDPRKLLR